MEVGSSGGGDAGFPAPMRALSAGLAAGWRGGFLSCS